MEDYVNRKMNAESTLNLRQFIYAVKAFAILSVICAHVAYVPQSDSAANVMAGNVLTSLGSIGVTMFFILSGLLFAKGGHVFSGFFRKRIKSIFIPWFATGTVVYGYVAIRKNGINLVDWIGFVSGNGSYLYFLPMLIACYLMFFYVNENSSRLTCVMVLSLASIVLTAGKVITEINPYMNPFNWFFYFGVGYVLFNMDRVGIVLDFAKRTVWYWACGFVAALGAFSFHGSVGYWTMNYLFFELMAVMCILGICSFPVIYQSRPINSIGQESFSIYLLQMPLAGIIAFFFSKVDLVPLTLLRPFVVLLLIIMLIRACKFMAQKMQIDGLMSMLMGFRE